MSEWDVKKKVGMSYGQCEQPSHVVCSSERCFHLSGLGQEKQQVVSF